MVRFEFPFQKRNTRFECFPVSAALRQCSLWCGHFCVLTQVLSALAGPEQGRYASSGAVSFCFCAAFQKSRVGGMGGRVCQISVLTLLFSPAGVPDRYHLRPNLGGHPSALQQQQHQHADSHPQQVHWLILRMCCKCQIPGPIPTFSLITKVCYIEGFLMKYNSKMLLWVFYPLHCRKYPVFTLTHTFHTSYCKYLIWEQSSSLSGRGL